MYSKSFLIAIGVVTLSACVRLPWRDQPVSTEVNLAFTIQKNLLVITSATINNHAGRFVFGSAGPRTVLDATFAQSIGGQGPLLLKLSDKEALGFTPLVTDLHGAADAILGADVWGRHAVTIDYVSGLLTYQKEGIHPEAMTLYRFNGEPKINVSVDGRTLSAIVDTTSPDTLILPRGTEKAHRASARLAVAGTDFGNIDVAFADVAAPRLGNRVISKFLVTIDYGRGLVGLWRDPRTQ